MADLQNINKYIDKELQEALQTTLAKVVKDANKGEKLESFLDRSTQPLGVTKILKQGFTP